MADKSTESSQSTRRSQQGAGGGQAGAAAQPEAGAGQAGRESGTEQQGARGARGLQRRSSAPFLAGAIGLSPFSLMRRMMEDMDRIFEEFGSGQGLSGAQAGRGGALASVWTPPVEVFERDGALVVRADLPGLSPDDVRIEVADDALVLQGERRQEIEVEEEGVYRSERVYGRFSRAIPLPEGADVEKAQARFENGVLEVSIPLAGDQGRRRRIEIQGGSRSTGGEQSKPPDGSGSPVH